MKKLLRRSERVNDRMKISKRSKSVFYCANSYSTEIFYRRLHDSVGSTL